MLQKVYKLCFVEGCKFLSHYANGLPDEVIVEYKIGKRTYPKLKGSYLYASKEPINETGTLCKEDYVLLECIAEVNTKKKPYLTDYSHTLRNIENFWKDFPELNEYKYGIRLLSPDGFYKTSVLCKWIKPVKIIG